AAGLRQVLAELDRQRTRPGRHGRAGRPDRDAVLAVDVGDARRHGPGRLGVALAVDAVALAAALLAVALPDDDGVAGGVHRDRRHVLGAGGGGVGPEL